MQSDHTYGWRDAGYAPNKLAESFGNGVTSQNTPRSLDVYSGNSTAYPDYTVSSHNSFQNSHSLTVDPLYNTFSPLNDAAYTALGATAPSSYHPPLEFHLCNYTPRPVRRKTSPRKIYEGSDANEGLDVRDGIRHPYARLRKQKEHEGKRRKTWNLRLEKSIFTAEEISTMPSPHRRKIYVASLEAHIDRLHQQLAEHSLTPVPLDRLEPYRGLNPKMVKSMICGLQYDASEMYLKLLELQRANMDMERTLDEICVRSSNTSSYYYIPDSLR